MKSLRLILSRLAVVASVVVACATPDWSGMSEAEISQWKGLGASPEVAQRWAEKGFGPIEYSAWTANGFDAEGAAKWKAKTFAPSEAGPWKQAGFDLDSAVENRRKGLSPIGASTPGAGKDTPK